MYNTGMKHAISVHLWIFEPFGIFAKVLVIAPFFNSIALYIIPSDFYLPIIPFHTGMRLLQPSPFRSQFDFDPQVPAVVPLSPIPTTAPSSYLSLLTCTSAISFQGLSCEVSFIHCLKHISYQHSQVIEGGCAYLMTLLVQIPEHLRKIGWCIWWTYALHGCCFQYWRLSAGIRGRVHGRVAPLAILFLCFVSLPLVVWVVERW